MCLPFSGGHWGVRTSSLHYLLFWQRAFFMLLWCFNPSPLLITVPKLGELWIRIFTLVPGPGRYSWKTRMGDGLLASRVWSGSGLYMVREREHACMCGCTCMRAYVCVQERGGHTRTLVFLFWAGMCAGICVLVCLCGGVHACWGQRRASIFIP